MLLAVASQGLTKADPKIKSAYVKGEAPPEAPGDATPSIAIDTAYIDQIIVVELDGTPTLAANERMSFYLDGVELKGAELPTMPDNKLEFSLERMAGKTAADQAANKLAWDRILRSPSLGRRSLPVAIGPEGKAPYPPTSAQGYPMVPFAQIWTPGFVIFAVAFALLLAGILKLGKESDLLRDTSAPAEGGKPAPYSLARCQMALWLFLIVSGFGFLYLVTLNTDTVGGSALALLGISGGTGLVSVLIDRSHHKSATESLANIQALLAEARAKLAAATVGTDEHTKLLKEVERLTKEEQQIKNGLGPIESKDFLTDLLSDGNGITVYRLQIAVWTVVLGLIFLWEVYRSLSMPVFSDTLLGLMGLSGATYLGFKTSSEAPLAH